MKWRLEILLQIQNVLIQTILSDTSGIINYNWFGEMTIPVA